MMVSELDKRVAHDLRDLVTRMQQRLRKQISKSGRNKTKQRGYVVS